MCRGSYTRPGSIGEQLCADPQVPTGSQQRLHASSVDSMEEYMDITRIRVASPASLEADVLVTTRASSSIGHGGSTAVASRSSRRTPPGLDVTMVGDWLHLHCTVSRSVQA